MSAVPVDPAQIEAFTDALLRYASDGVNVSLRAFVEGGNRPFRIEPTKINGAGVAGVARRAVALADASARNVEPIVFCPPLVGFQGASAAETDAVEAYAITVDCDLAPNDARRMLEAILGPATVVVASGGDWSDPRTGEVEAKLHLHWRLSEPASGAADLAKLKEARRLAATIVGGDQSGAPVVHPIRWPGSVHRKGAPRLVETLELNEAAEIDLGDALERLRERASAIGAPAADLPASEPPAVASAAPVAEYGELLASVLRGESLHDSTTRLAAKLVGSGMLAGAAVSMLRGAMDASAAPRDERWRQRYDDIPRCVSSAEAKFAPAPTTPVKPIGGGWARPFTYRDPSTIPLRQWLYGAHYCRRFVTTTVAPGGLGKSALVMIEALAMVTGRDLLGVTPDEAPIRVWLWNGEDPLEETERRIAAAALHYRLKPGVLEAGLMIGSGRDEDLVIAQQTRDGATVNAPQVEALVEMIRRERIDLVVIDPFVSSHRVTENDNGAIDRVVKTWARIADRTGAAVELVHHTRKGVPGMETTVEDGRGAVALLAAARSARVLNVMTEAEADKAGVEKRRSYFSVANGKANLAPPPEGVTWRRFVSQSLGNGGLEGGDSVGVVTSWTWPDHRAGVRVEDLAAVQLLISGGDWRERANVLPPAQWAGAAVARVLNLDLSSAADKAKASTLLKDWISTGALAIEDRKNPKKGGTQPFVVVGKSVSTAVETFE